MSFIPFAMPHISDDEINAVCMSMRSGWLTTGPKTKQFESDFARFIGANHALAVNSATAGLHLALEAIGVSPGDKVITTIHTFTATAEVIRYLGADPVFVDIEGDTFNIDTFAIRKALIENPEVKVIMPVHYAGQACNMKEIISLAKEFNVNVVEDAAHALPTTFDGQLIGNFGDVTVYSFYANKTITTGEGGMIVTNSDTLAERIRTMRLHGINRDIFDRFRSEKPAWYYEVVAPGYKYNMTDIAASMGIHQLKKAWWFKERRASIAMRYMRDLKDLPIKMPQVTNYEDTHSWHLFVIQLDLEKITITRDQFIELMSEHGVGASVHYIPLHMQPYWKENYNLNEEDFPRSTKAFERIVSLPNFPSMTGDQEQKVINVVRKILTGNSK